MISLLIVLLIVPLIVPLIVLLILLILVILMLMLPDLMVLDYTSLVLLEVSALAQADVAA